MPSANTNKLFRETFVGQVLNHISRNRWLSYTTDNPCTESPAWPRDLESADSEVDAATTNTTAQQGDPNATPSIGGSIPGVNGLKEWPGSAHNTGSKDVIVVSWNGHNDPAVRGFSCLLTNMSYLADESHSAESTELVIAEENIRDGADMPPDLLDIHWFGNLHRQLSGHRGGVSRFWRGDDAGIEFVCTRVCHRYVASSI